MKITRAKQHVRDGRIHAEMFVRGKHIGHPLRYRIRRGAKLDEAQVDRHVELLTAADDLAPTYKNYVGYEETICHTQVKYLDFQLRVWHPEKVEAYVRWSETSHGDTRTRVKSVSAPADKLPSAEQLRMEIGLIVRARCEALDEGEETFAALKGKHGFSATEGPSIRPTVRR